MNGKVRNRARRERDRGGEEIDGSFRSCAEEIARRRSARGRRVGARGMFEQQWKLVKNRERAATLEESAKRGAQYFINISSRREIQREATW